MRSFVPFIAALSVGLICSACGSTDGDPLGGPYGGTSSNEPSPSAGSGANGTQGISGNDGSDAGSGSTGSASGSGSGSGSGGGSGSGSGSGGGSGSGSGSAADAGSGSGSGGGTTTAPTFTEIYTSYLASGTIGNCGASGCHSQMRSASGSYSWLKGKGQIDGTASSALGDPNQSILSWMGGNMPRKGPSSNATATADVEAWAASGAPNN